MKVTNVCDHRKVGSVLDRELRESLRPRHVSQDVQNVRNGDVGQREESMRRAWDRKRTQQV